MSETVQSAWGVVGGGLTLGGSFRSSGATVLVGPALQQIVRASSDSNAPRSDGASKAVALTDAHLLFADSLAAPCGAAPRLNPLT